MVDDLGYEGIEFSFLKGIIARLNKKNIYINVFCYKHN